MAIQVRELVIKASVESDGQAPRLNAGAESSNASPGEEMIKACVEKVLEILKEKNER